MKKSVGFLLPIKLFYFFLSEREKDCQDDKKKALPWIIREERGRCQSDGENS